MRGHMAEYVEEIGIVMGVSHQSEGGNFESYCCCPCIQCSEVSSE